MRKKLMEDPFELISLMEVNKERRILYALHFGYHLDYKKLLFLYYSG